MTWSPNANFSAKLADRRKAPIYAVEIDGHSTVYTTGDVDSATWTYQKLLASVEEEPQAIDPITGRPQFGGLRFRLVDRDGEILDLISSDRVSPTLGSLSGRRVTLWMGFRGLAQADWETIGVYVIDGVSMPRAGVYEFSASTPTGYLRRPLFSSIGDGARARLRQAANAGDTYLVVGDASPFLDDTGALPSPTYLRVHNTDGAVYWYTADGVGSVGGLDTLTLTTTTGAYLYQDSEVRVAWRLIGHPVNILARLLLDDFSLSGTVQSDFPLTDVWGGFTSGDGLGLAYSDLDVAQWKTERDDFTRDFMGEVVVTKRERNALGYLSRFLSGLGVLSVSRSGLLMFRSIHLPFTGTGTASELTDSDATSWRWSRRFRDAITRVVVLGDEIGNEHATLLELEDTDMSAVAGVTTAEIRSPWLRSDRGGQTLAAAMASRLLSRVARGYQVIDARSHLTKFTIESGDAIALTHPALPATDTGASLSAAQAETISVALSQGGAACDVTAWRYAGMRSGAITPDSEPDYSSASATERTQYAFISLDSGLMSDGTSGYVWI